MTEKTRSAVIGGIVLGVLYLVESVMKTGLLFLVWPVIGGALAAYLYARNAPPPVPASEGAKVGALVGVIGGLILVIIGTPLVYLVLSEVNARLTVFGQNLPLDGITLILGVTLIYAALGLIISAVSGLVTMLIVGKR
jgi:Family of unknown function (DUF5518)